MATQVPNDEKLGELMLYVAQQSVDDPYFGATKLNKILFQADTNAYLHLGQPLTGHAYFKLANGPAPRHLVPVRDALTQQSRARIVLEHIGGGYKPQERLVALDHPRMSVFSADEMEIIDATIAELRPLTGTQLSARMHRLPGWRAAKDREDIPYETAFLAETVTQADLDRSLELAVEHGWI